MFVQPAQCALARLIAYVSRIMGPQSTHFRRHAPPARVLLRVRIFNVHIILLVSLTLHVFDQHRAQAGHLISTGTASATQVTAARVRSAKARPWAASRRSAIASLAGTVCA